MSRIQSTFDSLKSQHKKALVPYITAGDPHPKWTVPLMHAMVKHGADMIELGVPFSDPMADGPVIQRASERALVHKVGLRKVLDMVSEFRKTDQHTPVVLMGYANPVEAMGIDQFTQLAQQAGRGWRADSGIILLKNVVSSLQHSLPPAWIAFFCFHRPQSLHALI